VNTYGNNPYAFVQKMGFGHFNDFFGGSTLPAGFEAVRKRLVHDANTGHLPMTVRRLAAVGAAGPNVTDYLRETIGDHPFLAEIALTADQWLRRGGLPYAAIYERLEQRLNGTAQLQLVIVDRQPAVVIEKGGLGVIVRPCRCPKSPHDVHIAAYNIKHPPWFGGQDPYPNSIEHTPAAFQYADSQAMKTISKFHDIV